MAAPWSLGTMVLLVNVQLMIDASAPEDTSSTLLASKSANKQSVRMFTVTVRSGPDLQQKYTECAVLRLRHCLNHLRLDPGNTNCTEDLQDNLLSSSLLME